LEEERTVRLLLDLLDLLTLVLLLDFLRLVVFLFTRLVGTA
jgi:hypothetical protein